jgi:sulfur-oxidizing protein SoxZ
MAKKSIKAIAKVKSGVAHIKLLIKHPMDSGRKMVNGAVVHDKSKEWYMNTLTVTHKGKPVYEMESTSAVSKNPFIKFSFEGALKGEEIVIEWKDNQGKTDKKTQTLK